MTVYVDSYIIVHSNICTCVCVSSTVMCSTVVVPAPCWLVVLLHTYCGIGYVAVLCLIWMPLANDIIRHDQMMWVPL